jgi:hypothetical protein
MNNFELLCVHFINAFFLQNPDTLFAFLPSPAAVISNSNPANSEKQEHEKRKLEDVSVYLEILDLLFNLGSIVLSSRTAHAYTSKFQEKYSAFLKFFMNSLNKYIDECVGELEIEELDEETAGDECESTITKTSAVSSGVTEPVSSNSNQVTTGSCSGSSVIDDEYSSSSGSSSSNDDGISSCCSNISPKSDCSLGNSIHSISSSSPCSSSHSPLLMQPLLSRKKASSKGMFLLNARCACRIMNGKISKLVEDTSPSSLKELCRSVINSLVNRNKSNYSPSVMSKNFVYFNLPSRALKCVNFLTQELLDDLYGPGFDYEKFVLFE